MIRHLALALLLLPTSLAAESLRLAVTTSFENSGLSDVLLPAIEEDTELTLQLLVVGTGQALELARAGDVDAVIVHAPEAEAAFIAAGHGTTRIPLMYNDFILIGPLTDPAGIARTNDATSALTRIAAASAPFVSRGDQSGTHKAEEALWAPDTDFGPWYREAGSGMGATLNIAVALDAYTLTDRATWLTFGNPGDLVLLFEGDPALFNQYSLIPVNPARHPHVNEDAIDRLTRWLTSDRGRDLINGYTLEGETLFTWNAEDQS